VLGSPLQFILSRVERRTKVTEGRGEEGERERGGRKEKAY
jgi:hypothetical protein